MKKLILKASDEPWDRQELVQWRRLHSFSRSEAAYRLGVTERAIENWEQGRRSPHYPAAVRKLMNAVPSPRRQA